MDSLQNQVNALNAKVDGLHHSNEQFHQKILEVLSELKLPATANARSYSSSSDGYQTYQRYSSFELAMEHKDVLSDANYFDGDEPMREQEIAPEIQIRRLTAQLTAAYNRIAALEEQLLAQRVH